MVHRYGNATCKQERMIRGAIELAGNQLARIWLLVHSSISTSVIAAECIALPLLAPQMSLYHQTASQLSHRRLHLDPPGLMS